ncbi:thiamine pyrophosphate-dependent enzyme [Thalassotalea marina]|uniref:3-methyl-2-oxobutanoate dehydrogenase (2-methylpropanoyl-transferring) n=1 Tax=Thalassotalea marina TaxID=1673741 RepID=A0A919BCD0_9GAMM|nr:thiamine pyrophosphate-dependent enzyme [Thalassotalea marina]GHF79259.1 MFS transporter [Thalassotalea marina]
MSDRNQIVKDNFARFLLSGQLPEIHQIPSLESLGLTAAELMDMFESQVISRHLDLHSRVMQKQGQSFYTIGSSGHEGNAAVAKAFSIKDMAFLHYRSGAFMVQRSKQLAGQTPIYDMLLSFAASKFDPISGGRHKVLGSKALNVPPQTSTIASHLPKAMGTAFSIGLARRLHKSATLDDDSVVICSFGDASANHSTAQGAINSALWAAHQSLAIPIVFVCEDNGIGISTHTPEHWIEANFRHRPHLHYIACDGLNLLDTYAASLKARKIAKEKQQPVFLHIKLVRLLGHAGSDTESSYHQTSKIEENERHDPLLYSAKLMLSLNLATVEQLLNIYQGISERVEQVANQVQGLAKLTTAEQVMESIIPDNQPLSCPTLPVVDREVLFAHEKHNLGKKQHLAKILNWTMLDLMAQYDNIVVLGEDVARKGGVYNVTTKLVEKFGKNRVLNTLLDEQSILGGAIGLAHNGFLPMPEIQFLAYVHNAEDQIRGEAATLSFFSKGQFTNPMVIRVAGLAYQKGFGGHFHNDNSFAVFRDIPGVVIACPSNAHSAPQLLRQSVALAHQQRRVVVFLEPIALYMTKDLHQVGDGLWLSEYQLPSSTSPQSENDMAIATRGDGKDLCILSYGNGFYLSCQAQAELAEQGINCRIVDLQWLAPLDTQGIIEQVAACNKTLIVDECRQTGSISEALYTLIAEQLPDKNQTDIARICAKDSFIPLGQAAYSVLPSKDDIVAKAKDMFAQSAHSKQGETA